MRKEKKPQLKKPTKLLTAAHTIEKVKEKALTWCQDLEDEQ
jgi:hypothetical protein